MIRNSPAHVHDAARVLHVVERVRHRGRQSTQAVLIEIPHGQVAHAIPDSRTLLAHHRVVPEAEPLAFEVGRDEAARDARQHDAQRCGSTVN